MENVKFGYVLLTFFSSSMVRSLNLYWEGERKKKRKIVSISKAPSFITRDREKEPRESRNTRRGR